MTMSNPDALRDALDQLAGAADTGPALDPTSDLMTGIRAEARRNRNRVAVLTSVGLAAAVVVGYAALSAGPGVPRTDSGLATDPPTTELSTPGSPSPSPTPSATESSTESLPGSDGLPPLDTIDTRRADVDGDGSPDRIRLLVPSGMADEEYPSETWLEVRLASGTQTVQVSEVEMSVSFFSPAAVADLNSDGGSEILLVDTSGGESGGLSVWFWSVWSDDGLGWANNYADGTPRKLVNDSGSLAMGGEELGVAVDDGALFSWEVVEPGSQEVRTWKWLLDGGLLGAFEQPGTQCISFGVLSPC